MSAEITIAEVSWAKAQPQLCAIRVPVFVEEQGFAAEIELDGQDPDCVHVLALEGELPVATARMLPDGHIGRVSVIRSHRGRGLGAAVMRKLLEIATAKGIPRVDLDSQIPAIPFYERLGFHPEGPEFEEAGKPHQNMVADLPIQG